MKTNAGALLFWQETRTGCFMRECIGLRDV